jgi:arabinan endo-1,5-alpha-L-arabinosidase
LHCGGKMIGPGGEDVMLDGSTYRVVHHFYDANASGDFRMAIHNLGWTNDNWPTVGSPL